LISYIIGHRKSDDARERNLATTLRWLKELPFEIEIIVVEQDNRSKIQVPSNVKHIFAKNRGLYNRSWAFNIGAKHASYHYLAFADNDILFRREDFNEILTALEKFNAVNPYDHIKDLSLEESEILQQNVTAFDKIDVGSCRPNINIAGGVLFMQNDAFWQIGGWPEELRGWGWEDNIMAKCIESELSYTTLPHNAYHLYHSRGSLFDFHKYREVNLYVLNSGRYKNQYQLNKDQAGNLNKFSISNCLNNLSFDWKHRKLISLGLYKKAQKHLELNQGKKAFTTLLLSSFYQPFSERWKMIIVFLLRTINAKS
jgi:glycosyltransferase involved in cell wall biosynthesis